MRPRGKTRPQASSPEVSARMKKIRRRDTAPEKAIRSKLWRLGYRYKIDSRPESSVGRKADLTFRSRLVAVFIDGCYWHGCPKHCVTSGKNRSWWNRKIATNRIRDRDTSRRLRAAGWTVVRIWEHENVTRAVERLVRVLNSSRQ